METGLLNGLQLWLDAGISEAIYHQSRDALLAGKLGAKRSKQGQID